MSEKSASQLQIEEKEARIEAMEKLAIRHTRIRILEILRDNPKVTDKEILQQVKSEGIPIRAFLHTFITMKTSKVKTAVSFKIAHSYFESLSESMNPLFITFALEQGKTKIKFHLEKATIGSLIAEVRGKKQ